MATKPIGYVNGVPYYTSAQYSALINADRNRSAGRGNPGTWGTAGPDPFPNPTAAKSPAVTPTVPATPGTVAPAPTVPAPTVPAQDTGYQDLYQTAVNSPFYQQALAATRASGLADAASRKSAIQQALIQFGLVPSGFQDKYGDVDATTRSLADQNTSSGISAYARLLQAHKDAQRDLSRRLAARGLRRSGTRGYGMRRNQLAYDQNFSDSVAKLLGFANSTYGNFANAEYQRQMGLSSALSNAVNQMGSWWKPTFAQPSSFASTDYWQTPGSYTGGAKYATRSENPDINPIFWFK